MHIEIDIYHRPLSCARATLNDNHIVHLASCALAQALFLFSKLLSFYFSIHTHTYHYMIQSGEQHWYTQNFANKNLNLGIPVQWKSVLQINIQLLLFMDFHWLLLDFCFSERFCIEKCEKLTTRNLLRSHNWREEHEYCWISTIYVHVTVAFIVNDCMQNHTTSTQTSIFGTLFRCCHFAL